jgi:hypothetical protein
LVVDWQSDQKNCFLQGGTGPYRLGFDGVNMRGCKTRKQKSANKRNKENLVEQIIDRDVLTGTLFYI